MALVLGGAIGNVIDSTFYGIFLDNAPAGSPIKLFHGQVIDMLFFPLFDFYWPDWVPFWGGQYFLFFSPVFNIADASIFTGVLIILLFQKRFFIEAEEDKKADTLTDAESAATTSNESFDKESAQENI